MRYENNLRTYHGQADFDEYSRKDDGRFYIPASSIRQIKEAYKEFMDDLLLEAQEAY